MASLLASEQEHHGPAGTTAAPDAGRASGGSVAERCTKSSPMLECGEPRPGLGTLARRYLFFGWLFRDANVADPWVSSAALAFNIGQRRYLPIYIRRWSVVFLMCMLAGLGIEQLAPVRFALVPYALATFALCYLFVTIVIFISLELASHDRYRRL